jgi:hypothetical protein
MARGQRNGELWGLAVASTIAKAVVEMNLTICKIGESF